VSNSISPPEGVPEHLLRKFAHSLDLDLGLGRDFLTRKPARGSPQRERTAWGQASTASQCEKRGKIAKFAQKSFNGCPKVQFRRCQLRLSPMPRPPCPLEEQ